MRNRTVFLSLSDKPLDIAAQWRAPVSMGQGFTAVRYVAVAFVPTHIDAVTGVGCSDG